MRDSQPGRTIPARIFDALQEPRKAILAGLGGAMATFVLAGLSDVSGITLVMAPFGASCVLAFALPESPLSQPRSIIGGHLIATAVGLATASLLGVSVVTIALAVGLAIAAMLLTRTTHAPAGADPLLVMLTLPGWSFLLTPVLLGTLVIVAVAWVFHRVTGQATYPKYWL